MHAPSEHTVEGKTYPLELHIIHVDAETGGFGTVVGIFFEISEDPTFNNFYFDKIQPEQAAKKADDGDSHAHQDSYVGPLHIATFLQ
jgi:carbonic anhydrase